MKLKVVGPRILLRVNKAKDTFEGSSLVRPEMMKEADTLSQTIGEVIQLGDTAYKRKDAGCDGHPWVKVGDKVHFSRYGAVRINTKHSDEFEYWILTDKDILVIEEA